MIASLLAAMALLVLGVAHAEDVYEYRAYDDEKWGLTGFRSMFFSRTFWFRASDGLFVLSSASRGEWSQLVGESAPNPSTRRAIGCAAVAGVEALFDAGTVVLLGELHGTRQIPKAAGDLACAALARGLDVTVALEIPQSEDERIQAYLDGAGSQEDQRRLLAGGFWQRDDQDGRSSGAMLDLIESLRVLRARTHDIDVLLIDNELVPDRDVFMAQWLKLAVSDDPARFYLSLTGNVHSRIVAPEGRVTMGAHLREVLPEANIVALQATYTAGTAWVCTRDGCGVLAVSGTNAGSDGIRLFGEVSEAGFSGAYHVGAVEASRPALERD